MKTHPLIGLAAMALMAVMAGCAGVQPTAPPPPAVDPAPYLAKAQTAAGRSDYQKAMAYLRLANAVDPGNESIAAEKARFEAQAKKKADQSFLRGKKSFESGRLKAAQREFMQALKYDPAHAQAMDYLKNRLRPPSHTDYTVAQGESLRSIAEKAYNDPSKATLIAYFNDLKATDTPAPGTTLKLPRLGVSVPSATAKAATAGKKAAPSATKTEEGMAAAQTSEGQQASYPTDEQMMDDMLLTIYEDKQNEISEELSRARFLMQRRDYDGAIPISRQVLAKDPSNEEAAEMINAAFYRKGEDLLKKRNYRESLEMYEEVEPGYKNVDERIGQIHAQMKVEADMYYRQGVNFYVNENLPGAIDAWEKTLELDPDHQKATQDIEKARLLLKKLQAIQ